MYDFETGNRYPNNEDRIKCRNNFITSLTDGKINTKELFPHEIIKKVSNTSCSTIDKFVSNAQWKSIIQNIKDQLKEKNKKTLGNLIPLVDVSGSMYGTPLEVAMGLGLIISELTNEQYRDRILKFESNPRWHKVNRETTLSEKVESLLKAPWGGSTDFTKAMEMIYYIVESNKLSIEDVPDLIVFTDMQFDVAEYDGNKFETHYESIKNKFADLGKKICGKEYDPPRIIFWNLRGNSNTGIHAPVEVNTENVQLLSGFSPSLMKSILDGEEINNEMKMLMIIKKL